MAVDALVVTIVTTCILMLQAVCKYNLSNVLRVASVSVWITLF